MPGWTWADYMRFAIDAVLVFTIIMLSMGRSKADDFSERFPQQSYRVAAHIKMVRASYYGPGFAGRPTASGRRYVPRDVSCAHRRLKFGTMLRLTYKGRTILCPIQDRGPFRAGREIDLSLGAAQKLGTVSRGVAQIEMEILH